MMIFQSPQDRKHSRLSGTAYRWSFKYDDDENNTSMFWNPDEMSKAVSGASVKTIKFTARKSCSGFGRMSLTNKSSRPQQTASNLSDTDNKLTYNSSAHNLHDEYILRKFLE